MIKQMQSLLKLDFFIVKVIHVELHVTIIRLI